jgi:hypothetical protein
MLVNVCSKWCFDCVPLEPLTRLCAYFWSIDHTVLSTAISGVKPITLLDEFIFSINSSPICAENVCFRCYQFISLSRHKHYTNWPVLHATFWIWARTARHRLNTLHRWFGKLLTQKPQDIALETFLRACFRQLFGWWSNYGIKASWAPHGCSETSTRRISNCKHLLYTVKWAISSCRSNE